MGGVFLLYRLVHTYIREPGCFCTTKGTNVNEQPCILALAGFLCLLGMGHGVHGWDGGGLLCQTLFLGVLVKEKAVSFLVGVVVWIIVLLCCLLLFFNFQKLLCAFFSC